MCIILNTGIQNERNVDKNGRRIITLFIGHITVLRKCMWPIVTDRVVWSVCQSVTIMSPVKTAELIEMPFGVWTLVGPRNHILDWGSRSP